MPDRPPKAKKTTKGYEIPVSTRKEVYGALEKVAQDAKPLPAKKK
jgi:hypothetical protein